MNASPPQCRLEQEIGLSGLCPGEGCPFWEQTRVGGHCRFDSLDLRGRRQLAAWLLDLRHELADGEDAARRRFFERLNAGRSD